MIKTSKAGFTIVELLIVIVVIGILAAITVVAYNGIQTRANDTKIRSSAAQVQKALQLWKVQTGVLPQAGYGANAPAANDICPGTTVTSGGWLQSGMYPCTMQDLLIARGLLVTDLSDGLPPNTALNSSEKVFMFYPCTDIPGSYVLFWNLKSPSQEEVSNLNLIAQKCYSQSSAASLVQYSAYGMRSAQIIQMN